MSLAARQTTGQVLAGFTGIGFGQGLGDFLTRRSTDWKWLAQATPWVGMIAGATIGSIVYIGIGNAAIWLPVCLAGLLAACSVAIRQPD